MALLRNITVSTTTGEEQVQVPVEGDTTWAVELTDVLSKLVDAIDNRVRNDAGTSISPQQITGHNEFSIKPTVSGAGTSTDRSFVTKSDLDDVRALITSLVPIGTIISVDPNGDDPDANLWDECNGEGDYTPTGRDPVAIPNLQGRFLVGYSEDDIDDVDYSAVGDGGSYSLIQANLPSHRHTMAHRHRVDALNDIGFQGTVRANRGPKQSDSGSDDTLTSLSQSSTESTSTVSITAQNDLVFTEGGEQSGYTGDGTAISYRSLLPRYYPVKYYIKIA